MIKSLLARISAALVVILCSGLISFNGLNAQFDITGHICENTADDTNQDFSGVVIQLLDCAGAILQTTTSDASGDYEFTALAADCYDVNIVAPDDYCLVSGVAMAGFDPLGDDETIADVCFEELAKVTGVAWSDLDGDGILDGEEGIGNVFVEVTGPDGTFSTLADKDGNYSFAALCPGDFTLTFTTPTDYFITALNAGGVGSNLDSDIDATGMTPSITLSPGACAEDVNAGYVFCNNNLMSGILDFCITDLPADPVLYSLPDIGNGTYTWTLSGGGTLVDPTANGNAVQVDWTGAAAGTYTLMYSYDSPLGVVGACTGSFDIDVASEPASNVLACNNLINLSLGLNCDVEVSPDVLLEGSIATDPGYVVTLRDVEGDSLLSSNMVGFEYAGKTLVGQVTHICTGNSCWGNIIIEDKNIPTLICGTSTVNCGDDIDPILPGVTNFNFSDIITTDQEDVFNSNVNWPVQGTGCATVLDDNCFLIDATSLCGPSTLCFQDSIGALDCELPDFSQITYRKWTVSTPSGSSAMCTEEIRFLKPNLDDLNYPDHLTGDDALDCRFAVTSVDSLLGPNYWLTLPNGNPDPASPFHDLSPEGLEGSCNRIKTTFNDQRFGECSGSYKLQRTWVVLDWCTSEVSDSVQIIEVAQRGNIVCVAPPEINVPAGIGCSAAFDVPPPIIVFPGCSAITDIRVGYKVAEDLGGCEDRVFTFDGVTKNADGTYRIPNVDRPTDMVWIGYVITNECGQTCTACTEATFVDGEEPVAVCDQETVVSLNSDGYAYATPESFDDGSYDNCSLSHLEVMKISGAECGEIREFSRKIKFCCEDIGQKVEVHVKVIDNAGFENTCKSWVEVQDNFAPVLISCPPDMDADCNIDPMNLGSFGSPDFDGVCDINITADTTININDCGIGTIIREWQGVNSKGTERTCRQVINVGRSNPFDEDDIDWPENFDGEGCYESTNLDPRDLPDSIGLPIITDVNCSNISFDYEDVVLRSDESCIKIIREWTVLDWCQYTADPRTGRFVFNQVILLHDTEDPDITSGCGSMLVDGPGLNSNCQVELELRAAATDNCTPEGDLRWSYVIRDTETNQETSGTGNDASGMFGIGNYRISWTVKDNCDNEVSCNQTITVEDTKPPTPFCLGNLVTVLNQRTMSAEVWASDFVTGTADNCGPKENTVSVAFSEDISDTNITIDCSDFTSEEYVQEMRVYAIDSAGNSTYCEVRLVVQDNHGFCNISDDDTTGEEDSTEEEDATEDDDTTEDDDSTEEEDTTEDDDTTGDDDSAEDDNTAEESDSTSMGRSAIISGHIFTLDNRMVEDVEVNAYSDEVPYHSSYDTDAAGTFAFPELEMYKDYMVEASKSDNYSNGVSTLDLVLIQRHILGLKTFDSPYKVIAADANNSSSVSATDLVLLRRLILGLAEELPNNDSWRFVDEGQEFANLLSPFPFSEQIEYYNLETNEMAADFVAVKIGDVNNTVAINNLRSTEVRSGSKYLVAKAPLSQGEIMMVPFYAESIESLSGLQFTLDLGRSLTYKGISAKQISVSEANVGIQSSHEITFSWNAIAQDEEISADIPLFYVIVQSDEKDKDAFKQIQMNSSITAAELYTTEQEVYNLDLDFDVEGIGTETIANGPFKLYQNVPNPFSDETSIRFYLPQSDEVTFRLIDITGKVVMSNKAQYNAGQNEITVNSRDINTQGVLYYQLETKSNIANMKMIVLK